MPRTGTPSLAHGCQLTACLSLQRARVERRGFPNVFRALESFRLAMIWRADRREELSATLMGTRKLAPAERREMEIWITQPRRYAAREGEPAQGFRFAFLVSEAARLRHGRWVQASPANITPRLAAWACRMFPRHHRADTCAACLAPSIGTVLPAPVTDSSVCRLSIPFHCGDCRCGTHLHCTAFRSRQI